MGRAAALCERLPSGPPAAMAWGRYDDEGGHHGHFYWPMPALSACDIVSLYGVQWQPHLSVLYEKDVCRSMPP